MLNGVEMAELNRLHKKQLENGKPLIEADLLDMEDRVRQVYDYTPAAFNGFTEGWNSFCHILRTIANDNARLIAEVRRKTDEEKTPSQQ